MHENFDYSPSVNKHEPTLLHDSTGVTCHKPLKQN